MSRRTHRLSVIPHRDLDVHDEEKPQQILQEPVNCKESETEEDQGEDGNRKPV
jgi:hypothetical protein